MDPSPFYEKDLDADAERYLTEWAEELAPEEPLFLTLHLKEVPPEGIEASERWVGEAIHRYFSERQRLARLELHRLLRRGRTSLFIGLSFLIACLALSQLASGLGSSVGVRLLQESLTIAGWVAMWQPLQTYLYDWWPLRHRRELFRRMSQMPVELHGTPWPRVT